MFDADEFATRRLAEVGLFPALSNADRRNAIFDQSVLSLSERLRRQGGVSGLATLMLDGPRLQGLGIPAISDAAGREDIDALGGFLSAPPTTMSAAQNLAGKSPQTGMAGLAITPLPSAIRLAASPNEAWLSPGGGYSQTRSCVMDPIAICGKAIRSLLLVSQEATRAAAALGALSTAMSKALPDLEDISPFLRTIRHGHQLAGAGSRVGLFAYPGSPTTDPIWLRAPIVQTATPASPLPPTSGQPESLMFPLGGIADFGRAHPKSFGWLPQAMEYAQWGMDGYALYQAGLALYKGAKGLPTVIEWAREFKPGRLFRALPRLGAAGEGLEAGGATEGVGLLGGMSLAELAWPVAAIPAVEFSVPSAFIELAKALDPDFRKNFGKPNYLHGRFWSPAAAPLPAYDPSARPPHVLPVQSRFQHAPPPLPASLLPPAPLGGWTYHDRAYFLHQAAAPTGRHLSTVIPAHHKSIGLDFSAAAHGVWSATTAQWPALSALGAVTSALGKLKWPALGLAAHASGMSSITASLSNAALKEHAVFTAQFDAARKAWDRSEVRVIDQIISAIAKALERDNSRPIILNVDGRKLAQIVSGHQARSISGPRGSYLRPDPNAALHTSSSVYGH